MSTVHEIPRAKRGRIEWAATDLFLYGIDSDGVVQYRFVRLRRDVPFGDSPGRSPLRRFRDWLAQL